MAPSSDDLWDAIDIKMETCEVKMENFDFKDDKYDIKLEDFDMKMDSFDMNTPPMSPEWRDDNKDYLSLSELNFPFQSLVKPASESLAVVPDIGHIDFDPATIDDLSDLKFDLDFMNNFPDSSESSYMSSMEELENEEAVRYDCMWSSVAPLIKTNNASISLTNTNNTNTTSRQNNITKKRDRTMSATVHSFLESMTTDDDNLVHAALSSSPLLSCSPLSYSSPVTSNLPLLSSSPLTTSLACMDSPLYSEVSDLGETVEISYSDNDADDEIDVISDSSSDTNQSLMLQKSSDARMRTIRSNKAKQATVSFQSNIPHDNPYGDHCYVISAQPNNRSVDPSILGILTPTESSEDEELSNSTFPLVRSQQELKYRYHIRSDTKKRQIVRANQSLIKKPGIEEDETKTSQTKFKFHMKFKSQKPRSVLRQKSEVSHHVKRKAAVKNTFCPNPTQQIQVRQTKVVSTTAFLPPNPHTPAGHGKKTSREASTTCSSNQHHSKRSRDSPVKDKGQEVRDLHNTMERQRRIELKEALEEVKLAVPSIAHAERASKLTILTKATDYCHTLSSRGIKLRREMANEKNKNLVLKKKLRALQTPLCKTAVV